jgi:hypothetical protein
MIGYDIYDRFTMGAFSIVSKPDFDDKNFSHFTLNFPIILGVPKFAEQLSSTLLRSH